MNGIALVRSSQPVGLATWQFSGSVAICRRGPRRSPVGRVSLSGCFELELLADKLDRLSQSRDAETEGSLDDAGLAADAPP